MTNSYKLDIPRSEMAEAEADLVVVSLREVIEEHRDYLIERIEPDFGLLDKLRENKTLSRIEIADVRVQKTLYKRNSTILDYILAHDQCNNFILALRDAHQIHIANFIAANGQLKHEFGGDWPLTEKEISIIEANHTTLIDLLDPFGLVCHLFSAGVINNRQRDTISSKQTNHEKNEALLDILTRRSLVDYHKTISCLHASNQSHISQILDEGGVVVRVHANLQDDRTEDEIISRIAELLNGRSQEDSSRILEVAQQRVIGAKKGQSIVVYIFSKTLLDLLDLKEMYENGELEKHLCTLFTQIISRSQYVEVNVENMSTVVESVFYELFQRSSIEQLDVTLSDEEFERCLSYFPESTRECEQERKDKMKFSPSTTTVNDLPLELLDIILRNSYLLCIGQKRQLYSYTSESIVSLLASVNDYWHQIIKRRRFKKAVWRYLAGGFYRYRELSRDASISRNIRSYLVENMDLQAIRNKLRLSDCLTDVQARLVYRQTIFVGDVKQSTLRDNSDAWHILRSTDKKRYSDFCRSLRQTHQKLVARVAENGGVALKSEIESCIARHNTTLVKQLVERINDLHSKTKPRSHETEKELCQLMGQDIKILNAVFDKQALIWLWCKSSNALRKLENHIHCNTLMSLFTSLTKVSTSTVALHAKRCTIGLDSEQLKTKVEICPAVTRFAAKFEVTMNENVIGLTKLKNQIYAVCASDCCRIHVFEDQTPFHFIKEMEIYEINIPADIASCRTEDCLYVTDSLKQYVWKITIDRKDNYRFIAKKWLSFIYMPYTMSVNNEGHLLLVRQGKPMSSIGMYDCECNLILAFYLHVDILKPCHAVETPTGNFIIIHEQYEDDLIPSKVVSEVSRDGQMIIRTFAQKFTNPRYLSLYDDGKVFVADEGFLSGKVILLQSGQVHSQMICRAEDNAGNVNEPSRLCYDNETGQLIVSAENFVNIYTINRY